jgi:hypothetical protein
VSRSEAMPEDPGVQVNDPVTFRPRRDRRHVAGTVVWVDRRRGTVEVIDREGREHTMRIAEVRRQQWGGRKS